MQVRFLPGTPESMKIIKREQTQEFKNGNTCIAYEYQIKDPDINIALVKIIGRYPEKGYAANEICKEIACVIEGEGKVVVEQKEILIKTGDVIFLEPKEKFYWEGNLTTAMVCTPAWAPEQHKIVG